MRALVCAESDLSGKKITKLDMVCVFSPSGLVRTFQTPSDQEDESKVPPLQKKIIDDSHASAVQSLWSHDAAKTGVFVGLGDRGAEPQM